MKKIAVVVGLIIISVFIASVNANAETISFNDNSKYWSGWNNTTNNTGDDSADVIGIPNFTDGKAKVGSDLLTNLTFNRQAVTPSYWWVLTPGDLFIDVGADKTWDYVVDLSTTWTTPSPTYTDPAAGKYNIYSINLGLNSTSGYILSGTDYSGGWSGYGIRDRHPVAAKADLLTEKYGLVDFSGWDDKSSTTQYTFDFEGLDLGQSGQFTIGWQPNCANDVVYETLQYTPTPEPATMSLLGLGLAGLLRFRKKRA